MAHSTRFVRWLPALLMASPAVASARGPEERVRLPGFEIQLRAAGAIPLGRAVDSAVSVTTDRERHHVFEVMPLAVPLQLDVGYRFVRRVYLEGFVGGGLGLPGSYLDNACRANTGETCVPMWFRAGVGVQYNFAPNETLSPWIGYAIGREWLRAAQSGDSKLPGDPALAHTQPSSIRATYSGWQYAIVDVGVDVRWASHRYVGPYASFAFGEYDQARLSRTSGSSSESTALVGAKHAWVMLGFRAALSL